MRAVLTQPALAVPTGVTTTLLGAIVLVAWRVGHATPDRPSPPAARPGSRYRGRFARCPLLVALTIAAEMLLGLLAG